jgi:transposase
MSNDNDKSSEEYDEKTRWILAKEAVCRLGLSQREAADRYGLSYEALRKKCQREEWPIPARVAAAVPIVSRNRLLAQQEAESWLERGEQHRGRMFALAEKALKTVESLPPDVKDWSDVERLDKIARRAAGLDSGDEKSGNSFTLNLIHQRMDVPSAIQSEYIEAEAEELPGELPEDLPE